MSENKQDGPDLDTWWPLSLPLCLRAGSIIPRGHKVPCWTVHFTDCSQAATPWSLVKAPTLFLSVFPTSISHKWCCMPGGHYSHYTNAPIFIMIPFLQVCLIWPYLTPINLLVPSRLQVTCLPCSQWAQSLLNTAYNCVVFEDYLWFCFIETNINMPYI